MITRGPLAVAVFGALISAPAEFGHRLQISLALAAAVAALVVLAVPWMTAARRGA
ncbi:hypothetical protein [Streptomyces sp. NPDC026589]|uniref:hypothetical protein n=1 Tax=Streptomyces sp. NPDC026589 TaxID=3155609 RepID=UPI0033E17627